MKHPVNAVLWTPEGRRLLTGSSSGEMTLWNGTGFNFETIVQVRRAVGIYAVAKAHAFIQAHDHAIRAAILSHAEDWILSADHSGLVKYFHLTLNNVVSLQVHDSPIRDLAFSPNDKKFVTASDDSMLKIYDFSEKVEEMTLKGHHWDAKTVDWHPTKGLLVSGSKDHKVKLWDPRTGRCLTTLHGHKNTVSKTSFEPKRGHLLATCARDQTARVFDLRMMRDVFLLRGHEKDVSTLTWHPLYLNLLTTGGVDGSIFHYLLDEPNAPAGAPASISPYDSADPSNTSTQTIYPAHRLQYAHDFAVWSLAWHPLGHILASGSNDRVTRFWSRPRPGDTDCFKDRYHIGEAAAEAQGTWDRRSGRKMLLAEEEQEIEDEAEGLVDQKMPAKTSTLPGIPGLLMPGQGTSNGASKTMPGPEKLQMPTLLPGAIANMDPGQFAAMFAGGKIPLPPPPIATGSGQGVPLPPPLPSNFDFSKMPPGMFPPGFQLPQGFPPIPGATTGGIPGIAPGGIPGIAPGATSVVNPDNPAGVRRRAPLPSQQESLMEEQRRGKYRSAR